MDAVKAFNAELSSLYDVKPPISKAKMTALTRGAIKAIKFYKHVVQSVEKFILKCKPEYKVPGLYVIDSIVRQSRHQFGSDKDVFAPRFAKNMQQTFVNLFKCPAEDKSKVIRVLNLWQKNQVFAPEVIQPLFDLADPNHPMHKELNAMLNNGMMAQTSMVKGSPALQKTPTKTPSSTDPATLAQLGTIANNPYFQSSLDSTTIAQLQQLHRILQRQNNDGKTEGTQIHFDRKLLDFDYGSEEEEDHTNPSPKIAANSQAMDTVGSLLSNPEVLRQLQNLQQSMNNQNVHPEFDMEKLRKLQEMKQQEEEFDKHLAQTLPNLPFAAECEFKPNTNSPLLPPNFFLTADMSQPPPGYKPPGYNNNIKGEQIEERPPENEVEFVGANDDMEVIDVDHGDSRSPSRDRYSRRRRSRSRDRSRDRDRDRDRNRRSRRSRSRSKTRKYRSRSRERDRERDKEKEKEREKERERRKRGLPPIKNNNLSVCSTTLWVGHLSKLVHQEDLSDTFGEYGEIVSIDLIIPRGCAFIVMHRRQDATRCLTKLKNHKMQGKAITLAWAPGKGVKGKDLKDYWEGDLGVSYIPYSKLKPDMNLELLEDGGMIDEDTAPEWMKQRLAQMASNNKSESIEAKPMANPPSFVQLPDGSSTLDTSQPPPVPNAGLLAPPPMALPLVAPFQLNNRLIGMPPSMMGVPPPNLQQQLLSNQLLGMNASFAQGMMPPPIPNQLGAMDKGAPDVVPRSLPEQLMPFSIIPPHPPPIAMAQPDENMDVEMEDAEKSIDKQGGNYNGESSNRSNDEGRSRGRERNRWGRDNSNESREERRDREKALNDRLRQMAGDSSFTKEEPVVVPPQTDCLPFPTPFNNGESERFPRRRLDDFPPATDFEGPPLEYEAPLREFPGPEFEGPEFEGPYPPIDYEGPPLDYDMPRDFEPQMRYPMRGERFDDRRREFYPRDGGFGLRGPRFRPGMEMFGLRGPPMLRPPHMFPRGPMRGGPRMGPGPMWMERPNFPPRFEGPEFYRGPEPMRHRHERRRSFRGGSYDEPEGQAQEERRSSNRWSNSSPVKDKDESHQQQQQLEEQHQHQELHAVKLEPNQQQVKSEAFSSDCAEESVASEEQNSSQGVKHESNTTPLHDEPADLQQSREETQFAEAAETS